MATQFETVYARYRSRVKNYDLAELSEYEADEYQHDLLMAAIDDFGDDCLKDLADYDDSIGEFNVDLSSKEVDILATAMVYHFVEQYVYNTDALQNGLNTKDFSLYSPANLLEKMTNLYDDIKKQLRGEINNYSFRNGEISKLTE